MKKVILKSSAIATYTFTGSDQDADFSPADDVVLTLESLDDGSGESVYLSAIEGFTIKRARLVVAGEPKIQADACKSANIKFVLQNGTFTSADGNAKQLAEFTLSMSKYNEWEDKNVVVKGEGVMTDWKELFRQDRPCELKALASGTEFEIMDLDIPSDLVSKEISVFVELELDVERVVFTSSTENRERPKKEAAVGDAVYADSDGNVHFIVGQSVKSSAIPADWEFAGVVALREGTKATILHKNENSGIRFANCWLFKVTGLTFPLASSVSMVMQQGPASGSTPVEVGTYTSSEGVATLDEFVEDLDDWLQDNPTASGALADYGWHAAKMKDADGNDSCFIIVDKIDYQSRFSPVKSSTSGVTAPLHMWNYAGFTTDVTQIKRKDGVMTYAVVWNKDRFKAYNTNVNSPTDSLTTTGLFNEAGFEATTTVKGYYGTYDNYLDHMVPDTDATTGAYAVFKGLGKQTADRLNAVKYTPLNGTEEAVFGAEAYAAGQKAHSTASVPGLDEGDWYIPGIDEEYEIFSAMKTDGSDPVNAAFVASGSSPRSLSVARWVPASLSSFSAWSLFSYGSFYYNSFTANPRACCVALLDLES